eukprot:1704720-Amphidinium_carterae.1
MPSRLVYLRQCSSGTRTHNSAQNMPCTRTEKGMKRKKQTTRTHMSHSCFYLSSSSHVRFQVQPALRPSIEVGGNDCSRTCLRCRSPCSTLHDHVYAVLPSTCFCCRSPHSTLRDPLSA